MVSIGQVENISEKPETGENAADAPIPYPVENARHNYTVDKGNPQGLKGRKTIEKKEKR